MTAGILQWAPLQQSYSLTVLLNVWLACSGLVLLFWTFFEMQNPISRDPKFLPERDLYEQVFKRLRLNVVAASAAICFVTTVAVSIETGSVAGYVFFPIVALAIALGLFLTMGFDRVFPIRLRA